MASTSSNPPIMDRLMRQLMAHEETFHKPPMCFFLSLGEIAQLQEECRFSLCRPNNMPRPAKLMFLGIPVLVI